jgi:hypothetical protein
MAHFAEVNKDWVVERVIVVDNSVLLNETGVECEWLGEQFCQQLFGCETKWIQTSYSGSKYKNFASSGFTFDTSRNAFIPPKPYPSWIFNEKSCRWDPPSPMPTDGNSYSWDEEVLDWIVTPIATINTEA